MSLRNNGSPPLSTRMGCDISAIWSMIVLAVPVERSSGELSSVALARQWMQRRLHPFVNSQKIRRGLYSFEREESEITVLDAPIPASCRVALAHLPGTDQR